MSPMKVYKKIFIGFASMALLSACSHRVPNELTHISGLRALPGKISMDDLRHSSKGNSSFLRSSERFGGRAQQINTMLKAHSSELTQVFNFKSLLLKHSVIPPVLSTSENIVNIGNDSVIRIADKMLTIVFPPRFTTVAPTWQAYLMMNYAKPETPDRSLLPKTREETEIWNKYIVKSWKFGIDQANHIFQANLSRLKRNFNGMILYKQLLAQHMVTPPFVAETTLGVTGNQQELRLNDRILRIASTANLITDTSSWEAALKNLKIDKSDDKQ